MATKYVHDTAAGRSIEAWVILRDGNHIATVRAAYSNSGRVLVNIYHVGGGTEFQHGSAGGYGYDKLTAALRGLTVDGHTLTDHCAENLPPPEGHKVWPKGSTPPQGYEFANYHPEFLTFGFDPEKHPNPHFCGEEGYSSCYRISGLKYLEAFGYEIIQAV